MSYNTKKQRLNLYKRTFLDWKPEELLATFTETSAELTSAIAKFNKKPDNQTYIKLCQSIGDNEVMIECIEEKFDNVRANIDKIKKDKLIQLRKQTDLNKEQEALNGKQKDLDNLLKQEKKPSLFIRIIKAPVVLYKYCVQSWKELKLYFKR